MRALPDKVFCRVKERKATIFKVIRTKIRQARGSCRQELLQDFLANMFGLPTFRM